MAGAEHGADPDDGGLIEDVVDEILGENLPPPKAEDPWERRQRVLETTTTVILSLAAVATAWATLQASQWSSSESDALAASSVARSKAVEATNGATRTEQLDTAIWLQWLSAFRAGDTTQAKFLRERFRQGLLRAHNVWVAKAVVAPDGKVISAPSGTPFTEPQYVVPDAVRADALSAEAEEKLSDSQHAASMSTKYVIVALVLALVLFFAGIATKFRNPKLQAALVALALLFCVFGLVRMLTMRQLL
jgi:protein-S-isoprenylcysteine O-methyltransferase Ste14